MGPWTYYMPLWLGTLVAGLIGFNNLATLSAGYGAGAYAVLIAASLACGILCQFILIGIQGVFAQVIPVPVGRSLRGGGAAVTGWLLLGGIGLSLVTGVVHAQEMRTAVWIVGAVAAGLLLGALLAYVWGLPTAVEDFGRQRRGRREGI